MGFKKVLNSNISEIRIFSRDEKQHDMRIKYKNPKIKFLLETLGIQIQNLLSRMLITYFMLQPQTSSLCEFFPLEAVKTNILGTDNVLSAAIG